MTTSEATIIEMARRNFGIDFMRGFAVLLVILHHIALRLPLKETVLSEWLPARIINSLIYNGPEAVVIFFVISGFLITNNSLQRWGTLSRIDIKSFYLRRFARIMPCLFLLVTILSALHLLGITHYVINRQNQSLGGAIFSALGMHLNWYEGQTGYLPGSWDVLWSLSIEEVFYFGFPILCLLLPTRRLLVAVLVILALSLPITREALEGNEVWLEKAYLPGMAAIATGVLTALLAQRAQTWNALLRQRIAQLLWIIGTVGLCFVLLFEDILWKIFHNGTMLFLTGASACLVLACFWQGLRQQRQRPFYGSAWLCTMGRQSYEIYLTHMFVVFGVVDIAAKISIVGNYRFLWYVPAVLLSWLLGTLVARWYSMPSDQYLLRYRLIRA